MLIKIKDYKSPYYPVAIEAYDKGRMIYQNVFPASVSDSDLRFQINSLWSNAIVKDCRSAHSAQRV